MIPVGDKKAKREAARRERDRRKAICVGNPETGQKPCINLDDSLIKTCKLCHCPIVLKTAGTCPANRW